MSRSSPLPFFEKTQPFSRGPCQNVTQRTNFPVFLKFPTVVETLGLNQTVTLVLTCPPYLIAGAVTILVSWSSGRFNERTWHITISKAVATVGFVAAAATLNMAGRYVAMVVFTIGTYGVNSLILGWCGSVCGQTKEKKSAAIAIVTTVMNISFICKFGDTMFLFFLFVPVCHLCILEYSVIARARGFRMYIQDLKSLGETQPRQGIT